MILPNIVILGPTRRLGNLLLIYNRRESRTNEFKKQNIIPAIRV